MPARQAAFSPASPSAMTQVGSGASASSATAPSGTVSPIVTIPFVGPISSPASPSAMTQVGSEASASSANGTLRDGFTYCDNSTLWPFLLEIHRREFHLNVREGLYVPSLGLGESSSMVTNTLSSDANRTSFSSPDSAASELLVLQASLPLFERKGIEVSYGTIAKILRQLDYSLQANKKTLSGKTNADRDAQFEYIENQIKEFSEAGEPSMSIDTKKKELVGDYKNAGREYGPKGKPIEVKVYDFPLGIPKATPYGVYFIANNIGWVNVGVSSDTAAFAVESIRKAWTGFGKEYYPNASKLLIVCDGGGSNGSRVRLFKRELPKRRKRINLLAAYMFCRYEKRKLRGYGKRSLSAICATGNSGRSEVWAGRFSCFGSKSVKV